MATYRKDNTFRNFQSRKFCSPPLVAVWFGSLDSFYFLFLMKERGNREKIVLAVLSWML